MYSNLLSLPVSAFLCCLQLKVLFFPSFCFSFFSSFCLNFSLLYLPFHFPLPRSFSVFSSSLLISIWLSGLRYNLKKNIVFLSHNDLLQLLIFVLQEDRLSPPLPHYSLHPQFLSIQLVFFLHQFISIFVQFFLLLLQVFVLIIGLFLLWFSSISEKLSKRLHRWGNMVLNRLTLISNDF